MNPNCRRIIYYISVVFTLTIIMMVNASCDDTKAKMQMLAGVDSISMKSPDSAWVALEGVSSDMDEADEGVVAYYNLLRTKVSDKLGRKHSTDSVIAGCVDYYEKTNDPHLAEAYYYLGRVNSDLSQGDKALYCFQMALHDSVNVTDYLRSRLFAQIGYVMIRSELYDEARKNQELAHFYCEKIGDTLGMRYSSEDIRVIDSLEKFSNIDEVLIGARLVKVQSINERVRAYSLRQENMNLQSQQGTTPYYWIIAAVIGVLAVIGVMIFKVKDKQRQEQEESKEPEERKNVPLRRFYDAEVMDMLESRIQQNKTLKLSDWTLVEERLLAFCPDFKERLYSLFNLSVTEYRICLLLKQELAPSKIAILMAMGVSSVSQCRLRMQQKAFDGEGSAKDWDRFVLSL